MALTKSYAWNILIVRIKHPKKAGKPIENPLKSVFIIWTALLNELPRSGVRKSGSRCNFS